MIIGTPKEVKANEYRVAVTPGGVKILVKNGHRVLVESGAGMGSFYSDEDYRLAGAEITDNKTIYREADLVYKVKEILPEEFNLLRENSIIITYFHSNAHRDETDVCIEKKITGIAYEDIQDKNGKFPLLRPMSEVAGKGGFIAACNFSQKINSGSGKMLARVNGVRTPHITIIGAGAAGLGAAELATGFGNKVSILDISMDELIAAKNMLPVNAELLFSDEANIENLLKETDVLINCISWPKWRKDHLVTREMLRTMKKEAMIVDVACDEGGAVETCRGTTHADPVYFEEGIMHYCVDNIPSAYSKTSSDLLCSSTINYILEVANKGAEKALKENIYLRKGLCFHAGNLTLAETGKKQERKYITPEEALGI
ncbi:MAG: alanine dehydrogenase [Proteocatella sp.]